jgi:hypothetical protein
MADKIGEMLDATTIGPFSYSYSERDVILYNLSLGVHWHQQRYVNENSTDFGPLPTFAVIPPYHDVLASVPLSDVLPKYNPVSSCLGFGLARALHIPAWL